MLLTQITFAAEVSLAQTKQVALNLLVRNHKVKVDKIASSEHIEQIITRYNGSRPTLRIVNFAEGGFALISADDVVMPVLGFSFDESYHPDIENPAFEFWLQMYSDQINEIVNTVEKQSPEAASAWRQYENPKYNDFTQSATIGPLMTAKWGQSCFYNKKCPVDSKGPCGHAVVGCVALSMGQIMYYYQYPDKGMGSHSYNSNYGKLTVDYSKAEYNWEMMADVLHKGNSQYHDEVAELLYHAGVGVNMNYSPEASGSFSDRVARVFVDHFGYHENIEYVQMTQQNVYKWVSMAAEEIKQGRPIYYSAYSPEFGGHAFNLDGLKDEKYFHINWGWDGAYNGYFILSDLSPGNYSNFAYNHAMVMNIIPKAGTITVQQTDETSYCKGGEIMAYFEYQDEELKKSNKFLLQLSDENGSFKDESKVRIIGQQTINDARYIKGTIPTDINPGGGYKLRVLTTSPPKEGFRSSFNIKIEGPKPIHIDEVICPDKTKHELANGIPKGGYFEGKFVKDGFFNSKESGAGNHKVRYYYEDINGCLGSKEFTVTVPEPVEITTDTLTYCKQADYINLYPSVNPEGGKFSGKGVINNHYFDAIQAGPGEHNLYYIYETPEGCQYIASTVVRIKQAPEAVIIGETEICYDSLTLEYTAQPDGGEFFGNNVSPDGTFDVAAAGAGTHRINYIIANDNPDECATVAAINLTVKAVPLKAPTIEYGALGLYVKGGYASYQWYLDGKPLDGKTDRMCGPKESGEYTVEGFHESGCSKMSEPYLYELAGIDEMATGAGLRYWPNPASDKIKLERIDESIKLLRIVDAYGKIYKEIKLKSTHSEIDLSDLASGVYYIEYSDSFMRQSMKLIIAR